MIDERNINNIIELIDSSNQKIKNIKEVIEEQKSTFELPENDFKNLATVVEEVLKSRNFDNLGELFDNIDKNISFKTEFLKEQYTTLDENILKVQNISKHIDKDISDDVTSLVEIVETFSYKIKILQGIVGDVNNKITTFNGDRPEVFLKDFRSDCRDFDEEFEQVLRELRQNFRRASEITNKLSKFDTGVDLSKELFSINISINAIMSAISVFDEKYRDLGKAFTESGLYTDFSNKIEDLSYNTKHLIRNIDSFNKIIEDGSSIKDQVSSLEQRIDGINGLIQQLNQEGFLEFKALLSSIDNSDDLAEIKGALPALDQSEKLEEIRLQLASLGQEEKFEEIKNLIQASTAMLNQEEKIEELKTLISGLNQGEQLEELKNIIAQSLEGSDYIQELKAVALNLSNAKVFGQFEHVLNEINSSDRISQDKLDELLRITSVVNFGEVEKEISFLTNDLEIILEEIKHSRSIADKSFSKLETIFDNFNLMELKNRIFDFENHLKRFLKKEDLLAFSNDISSVIDKFELANGVIIDGFDDIDSLKTHIMGFDEKFTELSDKVKAIMEEHQEKFDSAIEAFDNGYKIDEITNISNEILAGVNSSKGSVLEALNQSQEKLELLVKALDTTDKFDELSDALQGRFDDMKDESSAKLFEIGETSKELSDDLISIKASLVDIVRENQEKFETTINALESKAGAREMHDKLNFVLQTIEDKSAETSMQELSTKLADEINNGKYLVIDTIRESQIKLEEFVATIDNAEKIQDLKNVIQNLFAEVHQTKETIIGSIRDNQDRFELIVKAIDNTDRVEEVNDLSKTIYSEVISSKDALLGALRSNQARFEEAIRLVDVNVKVDNIADLSQKAIDEIKFTKEIIQNVGRSINPESLNSLQGAIEELKNSIDGVHSSVLAVDVKLNNVADKTDVSMLGDLVKERHEQLEYLIRAYDPTVELGAIKEHLDGIISSDDVDEVLRRIDSNKDVVYEVRSLLEEKTQNLELLMKSVENTDDINELRDFLFNIEAEQKDTKASIEALIRNAENVDDINYLKGLLLDIEAEQKDLKNGVEELIRKADDTSNIDGLHNVLSGIANEQKDLRSSIENIVPYDEFSEVKYKIDSNKEAIFELRSILDERSQNLELLMKSLENSDDINDLRDTLFTIENEQKDTKASIDAIARNSDVSERIDDLRNILLHIEDAQREGKNLDEINEIKEFLFGLGNEQKDIKSSVEALIRNAENTDDINYLKGLLLDLEQEHRETKGLVENIARNSDVSERIDDLRNILLHLEDAQKEGKNLDEINEIKEFLFNIENEQKDIKSSVEALIRNAENTDDINYLKGLLLDLEQDQKDLHGVIGSIARNTENIGDFSELRGVLEGIEQEQRDLRLGLNGIVPYESLSDIKHKVEDSREMVSELRSALEEKTQHLELVMKSLENTDDISELRDVLCNIESKQQELSNSLEYVAKSGETANDINELREVLYNIENKQQELSSTLEYVAKSGETSDDINYLKGLLLDLEQEQQGIKNTIELVAQNTQSSGNIDELRGVLEGFENGQQGIRQALESIAKDVENTDNVNYLKGLLLDLEQEQREFKNSIDAIAQDIQNIGSYAELKGALEGIEQEQRELRLGLNGIVPYESLSDIKHKVDDSREMVSELRSVLEERTQHLELVMKSIENTDDINDLRDILIGIEQEQADIKNIVTQALKTSQNSDEIAYLRDVLSDIDGDQKEIKSILENYLNVQGEDIRNYLGSIDNKVDAIEDIKGDISTFAREVENLKIGLDGVVRKSDVAGVFDHIDEIRSDLSGFTHDIAHLKQELVTLSENKDLEEAVEHLENIQYAIKESFNEKASIVDAVDTIKGRLEDNTSVVRNSIEVINERINEIKNATELNYDFRTVLNNIQEDQITLKALVSSMDDEESMILVKEQIRESEYSIRDCIEAVKTKDDLDQIKNQIDNITQHVVVQVMEVFENISFEQETQEIKEFVDESHNNVKSVLSVLKTNIERLLDAPKPIYIEELKQEIAKIAQNLDDIGPEMSEYVTTITSLRVSLEELSKSRDVVALLEQNIGAVSVDVEELLRASKETMAQLDLLYTQSEAKDDFARIRSVLETVLEKQQEQVDAFKGDDLKGGMDNVNLSINYINENLNEFLSEYRIFQDKLSDTVKNIEGMGATFVQSDSINSEFKKGVTETFKALKKEFTTVVSTVDALYQDMNKVSAVTSQMVETSAQDKADILSDMKVLRSVIENSEVDKLKDNFSTIIFSINGFLNNVDDKFAAISKDTQGAYDSAVENKEIADNIKTSIVHILEWTHTAARDFTRIQGSIEAFREVFDEAASDIKQIDEIKNIVSDLDSAVASRVEEVFDRQLQNKFDAQILPEFELLDKKIEKKLTQKLEPIIESREQDKEELRFVINNQLSSETASLRDLVDAVEKTIVDRIQNGIDRVLAQDVDFSEIVSKIDTEFVIVNDKLDEGLSKIDTELYQANVRLDDGLNNITQEVSGLNSTLEEGIERVNRNVRNINFNEITSKLEQGFGIVNQKIDDADLHQAISKIDDEFAAMNQKMDVDFFDLNKRVVDEFNLIEEKLDARSESMLQNIENSNEQLAQELGRFAGKIEGKAEQTVRSVETIKEAITNDFGGVVEKIDEKTNHLLRNVDLKMNVQGEVITSSLNEVKADLTRTIEQFDAKTSSVVESLGDIKKDLAQDVAQVVKKLEGSQEDAFDGLRHELVKVTDKIDSIELDINKSDLDKISKEIAATQSDLEVINNKLDAQSGLAQEIQSLGASSANTLDSIKKDLSKDISQVAQKLGSSQEDAFDGLRLELVKVIDKIDSIELDINKSDLDKISKDVADVQKELSQEIQALGANSGAVLDEISAAKNDLNVINGKLDAQTGLVIKNVEDSNAKLDKTLDQVTSKIESQSKAVSKNLDENKKVVSQAINDISSKLDTQTEIVFKNFGESKVELDEIANKLSQTSEILAKNIEASKEELEQELVQIIDKIDNQSAALSKAQDKKLKAFEEKLAEQEHKIKAIDDKLDILIGKLTQAQALDLSEVVTALENRMGSLDENIKKIVSFVDEE